MTTIVFVRSEPIVIAGVGCVLIVPVARTELVQTFTVWPLLAAATASANRA